MVGGVGVLHCQVTVELAASLLLTSWYRRTSRHATPSLLPDAGRFVYGGSGGSTLYVLSVSAADSADLFSCRVHHRAAVGGQTYSSNWALGTVPSGDTSPQIEGPLSPPAMLRVTVPEGEMPPRISPRPPTSLQQVEGEHFTLPCLAPASPPPHISWSREDSRGISHSIGSQYSSSMFTHLRKNSQAQKNAAEFLDNIRRSDNGHHLFSSFMSTSGRGGELFVRGPILGSRRAREEHAGKYTCVAANAAGTDRATYTVRVLQKLAVEAHPKSQVVSAGSRATVRCVVHGAPVAEVRWYKDGLPLLGALLPPPDTRVAVGGPRHLQRVPQEDRVLVRGREVVVRGVGGRDAGLYQCIAANALGQAQASSYLGVKDSPPEFVHTFIEQTLDEGPSVSLTCSTLGHPPPVITWTHDGRPLVPTSRVYASAGDYQKSPRTSDFSMPFEDSPHEFIENDFDASHIGEFSGLGKGGSRFPSEGGLSMGSWVDMGGRVVGQVNLSSVRTSDGGLYECSATNSMGKISHRARLNVFGPPVARTPTPNMTGVSGEELVLPCPIAGYPLTQVTWALDSRPITSPSHGGPAPMMGGDGGGRRALRGDGALVLRGVNESTDVGRYSCSASDAQGRTATVSFFFNVLKPPILASINFPENLVEKMRLSVSCSVMSGDLPTTLRWSLPGGEAIPDDPTVRESHTPWLSNLVFTDIRGRHAGDYTCTASNAAASTSVTATMRVRVPPHWVVEPQDVWVVGGEDLALDCYAHGTPTPTVSWRRPRGGSGASDSPPVLADGSRVLLPRPGALRILAAQPRDSGLYLCLAQNGVSPALSKVIDVSVLEGATVIGGNGGVANASVGVASPLRLTCSARGHPPLTFTWARDSIALHSDVASPPSPTSLTITTSVEDGATSSVLSVGSVERHHAGVYTCQAANAFGSDVRTYFVSVVERPDPPSHVHIVHVSSRSISLAWAPPFDGNSPLTHYVLQHWSLAPTARPDAPLASAAGARFPAPPQGAPGQAYLPAQREITDKMGSQTVSSDGRSTERFSSSPVRVNTTVRADVTQAKVELLTPGVTYLLQLLAVNSLGASDPSPPLSVTTHQEPPAHPPSSLYASKGGLGQITVTWKPPMASPHGTVRVTGYQVGYHVVSPKTLALQRDRALPLPSSDAHVEAFVPSGQAEILDGDDDQHSREFTWRSFRLRDSHPDSEPLTMTLRSLRHYTKYAVTVRAVNEVGPGPVAHPVTVTTSEAPPVGAPGDVACSALSSRSVRVRWGPLPDNSTNGVILGYKLTYHKLGHLSRGPPNYEMKRTTNLETNLQGLERYSEYSVTVRAYNTAGDGKLSQAIKCLTLEDVPSTPSPLKAVAGGPDSVILGWHSPLHPNGVITHYTLYYRPLNAHHAKHSVTVEVHPQSSPALHNVSNSRRFQRRDAFVATPTRRPMRGVHFPHMSNVPADLDVSELVKMNEKSAFWIQEIDSLDGHASFEFWMTASTAVGESPPSRGVVQSPTHRVSAEILTQGGEVVGVMGSSLTLPCPTVGTPQPVVAWSVPGKVLPPHHTLELPTLAPHHTRNYTCTARNTHNTAAVVWRVRVVTTPVAPTPFVEHSTHDAIHITWSPPAEDGGLPIVGYIVRYKLVRPEAEDDAPAVLSSLPWQELPIDAGHRNFAVPQLLCGAVYRLLLLSRNAVGRSSPSVHVTTRTKGTVPRISRWQDIISINSTAIHIHLYGWASGGCDIQTYAVSIAPVQKSRNKQDPARKGAQTYPSSEDVVVLDGLEPGTWYVLSVSATNSAGTTTHTYHVATADLSGALVSPSPVVEVVGGRSHKGGAVPPYLEAQILAPVVSGGVCTLALLLCVLLLLGRSRNCSSRGRPSKASAVDGVSIRSGGLTAFSSLLASVRDTSREQLSPARAKQEEAYRELMSLQAPDLQVTQADQDSTLLTPGLLQTDSTLSAESLSDGYKVPVRIRRGVNPPCPPPGSSTESYEEAPPSGLRRLSGPDTHHRQQYQRPQQWVRPVAPQGLTKGVYSHGSYADDSSSADTLRSCRSRTMDSVYSVDGGLPPLVSTEEPLRPPSGFSDGRGGEADGGRLRGGKALKHSMNATNADYSIHV